MLRPIAVSADTALPLVVQAPYARIGRDGETLTVAIEREPARSRLGDPGSEHHGKADDMQQHDDTA